ncbi:MAG: chitobiase/beta-hexosaminidase C-terminal domain-containing protein [Clostridiales Family XIII bacterium]|jgi:tetratricopeptide (TPR) repeat protein|nr:chitobiase/beta-hexosaminidase C-terminal domain-containing protein [Clostridiales Family XIII bacterium]
MKTNQHEKSEAFKEEIADKKSASNRAKAPSDDKERKQGAPKASERMRRKPAARKNGDKPALSERQRKRMRTRIIVLSVAGLVVLAAAGFCVYYFGFVRPMDNYDAQMKVGEESYEAGVYEDAEAAFLKALEYESGDSAATFALADTYVAWKKFDKAVILFSALQDEDEADTRTYERLISLYAEHTNDIDAANAQIVKAYERGLSLESELVVAPPVFEPKSGTFNEATIVTVSADEGQVIYYTMDGSVPTLESIRYEGEFNLNKKTEFSFFAAVIAENGLMGWPAAAEYVIDIQYAVNSEYLGYIGRSAAEIMNSAGALFYVEEDGGAYCYRNKSSECIFAFPLDSVPGIEVPATTPTGEVATDGAVTVLPPDPNRTPLRSDAVCVAVEMNISRLFVLMNEAISVEDLMAGLNVENYTVSVSETDGLHHLYYGANGYTFDYALKDENTVSGDGRVVVRPG